VKNNRIKLFFANLFDLLIGKIISVKITESEEKMRNELNLTAQCYKEYAEGLENDVTDLQLLLTPKKVKEILDPSLHEIEEKGLKIRMKTFMSDHDMKTFYVNSPCWTDGRPDFHICFPFVDMVWSYARNSSNGGRNEYAEKPSESIKKFITTVFATNCVSEISANSAFEFILKKPGSLNWDEAIPKINEAIASLFPDKIKETENENEKNSGEVNSTE
jgi:hypothetical protein